MMPEGGVGDGQLLYGGKWIADVSYDIHYTALPTGLRSYSAVYTITNGRRDLLNLDQNAIVLVDEWGQLYKMLLTHGSSARLVPLQP